MHRLRFSPPFLAIAALLGLGHFVPARAHLVVLVDGSVLKAADFEAVGEQARVTLATGGRMTLPILRVERVVDDEWVPPAPEPPAPVEAVAEAVQPVIPLHFDEAQAKVPDGPYGPMIFETAKRHKINPQVVAALIRQESAGKVRAVSHKGARGLMQLMPATAQRFGVRKEKLFDPQENLEAGVRYLSWLLEQFPNDLARVLAAYNAGENAVIRYGGIPPYRETQNYVKRIYSTLGLTISQL